jgi:hypothetical protein
LVSGCNTWKVFYLTGLHKHVKGACLEEQLPDLYKRDHLEGLGMTGKMILRRVLQK